MQELTFGQDAVVELAVLKRAVCKNAVRKVAVVKRLPGEGQALKAFALAVFGAHQITSPPFTPST